MKKLLVMVSVISVLFGISAGASWYLRQSQAALSEHADGADPIVEKVQKSPANQPLHSSPPAELRPAVRPSMNSEVDNAAKLANNLRTQTDALRAREQQFATRQKS